MKLVFALNLTIHIAIYVADSVILSVSLGPGRVKNNYACLLNQFPGKNPFIPDDKLSFLLLKPVAFLLHTVHLHIAHLPCWSPFREAHPM